MCAPTLDRTTTRAGPGEATALARFLETLGLVDIWRRHHPTRRAYSYFSGAHRVFSRLDYLFAPAGEIGYVEEVEYLTRGISDHSPLYLKVGKSKSGGKACWKLNAWALKDQQIAKELRVEMDLYFKDNYGSVQSAITLWEAFKAVLRDRAQNIIAHHKRQKLHDLQSLESKLLELENTGAPTPDAHTLRQIDLTKREYQALAMKEVQAHQLAVQHRLYETGDRTGKLLAWLGRKEQDSRWVESITEADKTYTTPQDISEAFDRYYAQLYAARTRVSDDQIASYLADIELPRLAPEESKALDEDITLPEVVAAINKLKMVKTPGPNGLPGEFFKRHTSLLAPHLLKLFTESRESGSLPADLRAATVVVIHKAGKPSEDCGSYRPISLLNVETKVLATILATRLINVITSLINDDQSGFMPRRATRYNLRRVANWIEAARSREDAHLLLSLDAEKAFDTVHWPFMLHVLEKLGFGLGFRQWITLLYTKPEARVRVNGAMSRTWPIQRGTRQGCPLSPLIFALILVPLACIIRAAPGLGGFVDKDGLLAEERISLYADDILLYVTDPGVTLPRILTIFETYGRYSGYKINWTKSTLYPISGQPEPQTYPDCLCRSVEGFTYLGLYITIDVAENIKRNVKRGRRQEVA